MTAARPSPANPAPRPRKVARPPALDESAPRAPTASRLLKEQGILTEAENQFAQFGFEGASLESIAAAIGISRHNLLYYFPSKEALYQRVLDDVLTQWLAGMEDLSHSDDPQQALRRYIRAKLHYSRTRPQGAKVFTKEVIAGAPRYGTAITERVAPLLKTEVAPSSAGRARDALPRSTSRTSCSSSGRSPRRTRSRRPSSPCCWASPL